MTEDEIVVKYLRIGLKSLYDEIKPKFERKFVEPPSPFKK